MAVMTYVNLTISPRDDHKVGYYIGSKNDHVYRLDWSDCFTETISYVRSLLESGIDEIEAHKIGSDCTHIIYEYSDIDETMNEIIKRLKE